MRSWWILMDLSMDFDGFCHILSSAQSTGLGPRIFSMQIPILDCHRSIQTGCHRFFATPQMVFTGKSSPSSPETMVFTMFFFFLTMVFTMVFTGVSCKILTDVPWKNNPMIERLSYCHPQMEKSVAHHEINLWWLYVWWHGEQHFDGKKWMEKIRCYQMDILVHLFWDDYN